MNFGKVKLDKQIVDILNKEGITEPTAIQANTYMLSANGHDVIGVSETGSGKTLAFLLPVVNQYLLSDKSFHTLIITPTRELAIQISETIRIFSSLGIKHSTLIGGELFTQQVESINQYPHVVIGTPGGIVKHIEKTKNFKIGQIRKLVLDEADRFFENDFIEELDKIAAKLVKKNQSMMFTATLTDKVKKLSNIFMKNPRIIQETETYDKVSGLVENYVFIAEKYKLAVLKNHLDKKEIGIIIFVGMAINAERLVNFLKKYEFKCEGLYGGMDQKKRENIMKRFRNKEFNILIATDLASRGLDISGVDEVINYDLPNTANDYIHRVGRTARCGKEGVAISFVTQYDVVKLQKLEHMLKRKLIEKEIEGNENFIEYNKIYGEICSNLNRTEISKKRRLK